jgi:hypothetical protein
MEPITYSEPADVEARLAQLGLSSELLREAIQYGEMHRNSCTANDPPTAAGYLFWARTTRGLREFLASDGWARSEEGQLSTVVNPNGAIAIAVSSGDQFTGIVGLDSNTRYSKGPATVAAIEQNAVQLALFDVGRKATSSAVVAERMTWFLLVYRGVQEIRSELSLAHEISDEGRVESWAERIILPVIGLEPEPDSLDLPNDGGNDFDVEISRRKRS